MSACTPARLRSLPTDHPVTPETTEAFVQQRYEIAPPATRQGFAPRFTKLEATVLFDAYYLCPALVQAVLDRGWD